MRALSISAVAGAVLLIWGGCAVCECPPTRFDLELVFEGARDSFEGQAKYSEGLVPFECPDSTLGKTIECTPTGITIHLGSAQPVGIRVTSSGRTFTGTVSSQFVPTIEPPSSCCDAPQFARATVQLL